MSDKPKFAIMRDQKGHIVEIKNLHSGEVYSSRHGLVDSFVQVARIAAQEENAWMAGLARRVAAKWKGEGATVRRGLTPEEFHEAWSEFAELIEGGSYRDTVKREEESGS